MSSAILFATDLHGNARGFKELFARAVETRAAAIVLGGDLCPHAWLEGQSAFLRTWLAPRLRSFRKEHQDVRVFGLLGNDDWGVLQRELEGWEQEGAFCCLHQRAHQLTDGLWIAGSSFVPVTPFGMSDFDRLDAPGWKPPAKHHAPLFSVARASEPRSADSGLRSATRRVAPQATEEIVEGTLEELKRRETLEECLAALARLSPPAQTVYVLHAPPAGTRLDRILDGAHVGSVAIRRFIESHQPPLTLHGHIHESPLVSGSISDFIRRTLMLNPGDSQTKLRALRVTLEGTKIEWETSF